MNASSMFKVQGSKFKARGAGSRNLELGTLNLERRAPRRHTLGVTLLEMIMVIVITGIIGAAIALFIRAPVESYVDATRRAELTDIADTALRRITRDLRTALPNSVRVDGTGKYIEYLQTSGGGRYRAEKDSGGLGETLDFTTLDTQFDVIGPMPSLAPGDQIVIYNLGSGSGSTDAYAGGNRTAYSSLAAPTVTIAAKQFPFASPGKRFQVVQYPVTYACEAGVLRRYWGYPISVAQPVPPVGGNSALLATNVAACTFSYTTAGATQRTGVVSVTLQIAQSGESVRLFQQAHVNNLP
jgi:MSHA biogenesis protein MshO